MAQFRSLSDSSVALPVGVLIIVLTMVYSPVTGQVATTALLGGTTFGNMTENPNSTLEEDTTPSTTTDFPCATNCLKCTGTGEKECTECFANYTLSCKPCEVGECITGGLPLPILIGAIAGGVALLVLVVVIIICCCRRRGPPTPVKRDFRLSAVNTTHATSDADIYGNVDNQGNVIRYNMPDEIERSPASNSPKPKQRDFGDIYENNMPSLPTTIFPSQGKDYGDVYENAEIGNLTQPVAISRSQPRSPPSTPVRPSPARKEEEDFGGDYTNAPIHNTTKASLNMSQDLLQRLNKVSPSSHQAPSVPGRPAPTTSQPSRCTVSPHTRPTNLPLSQRDNLAFEGDSPHGDIDPPLPKRPAPKVNLTSQSLRHNPVAPEPGSRFNSLPVQPRESPHSHFTELDDVTDQPTRPPPAPPSQKPKKQTSTKPLQPSTPTHALKPPSPVKASKPVPKKKGKLPPKTFPKRHIERHIDDDVRGEVIMGAKPVPSTPDHGDVYEEMETQKDSGENYEVCDIQPKLSPREDFGLSYEYVDPKQDTGTRDYGGSYEVVDTSSTQDYGGDYEDIGRPKLDINHRAPLPTPGESASNRPLKPQTPAKTKPALPKPPVPNAASGGVARSSPGHHNTSGQDSDNEDHGEDYLNVPNAGGGKTHPQTYHPKPPLPVKLNCPQREKDFYDDVLQAGDDGKEVEDDEYEINQPSLKFTPGKHYRNVPAKREEHQRHGNYIQIQGKGH